MLHQMASDINKLKRPFYLNLPLLSGNTEIIPQATSCRKPSEDGSLPQIHGRTITSPMNCAMRRPRRGSFSAKHSQNGNGLDRVHFYGFMENVS